MYVIYDATGKPKYVGQSIHIDERLNQHISDSLKPSTKPGTARYDPAAGDRAYVLHRTDDPDALNGLEQHEIDRHNTYTTKTRPNPKYNGVGLNKKKVYRDTNRNAGVYDAARDAHLQRYQRPSSPADQRQIQQASTRQSTDQQRQDAQSSAREANQTSSRSSSESNNSSSHKSSDNKKKKKPKKKKSSRNHPKPKG